MTRFAAAALVLFAACGGASSPVDEPGDDPVDRDDHVKVIDDGEDEDPDDGVEIVSTRGRMEQGDIEEGLEPHAAALEDCYLSRVGKQKWLGGKVEILWEIDKDGVLTSAQISSGDLGAWPIEKCLLDTARAIAFAKPKGGPADFSIPLEFTARGSATWWDEERGNAVVSRRLVDLEACAETAPEPSNVMVTLYVGTRGAVQSAGFSSMDLIDDTWAECAHGVTTGWTLSDPKGKVAKMAFVYNPQASASEDDEE